MCTQAALWSAQSAWFADDGARIANVGVGSAWIHRHHGPLPDVSGELDDGSPSTLRRNERLIRSVCRNILFFLTGKQYVWPEVRLRAVKMGLENLSMVKN